MKKSGAFAGDALFRGGIGGRTPVRVGVRCKGSGQGNFELVINFD